MQSIQKYFVHLVAMFLILLMLMMFGDPAQTASAQPVSAPATNYVVQARPILTAV